jgi:hypothetical protein
MRQGNQPAIRPVGGCLHISDQISHDCGDNVDQEFGPKAAGFSELAGIPP